METIFTRRSIRKFTEEPVLKEHIDLLIKAALCAPSARNAKPWEFIIVQNKKKLNELADLSPYAKPLKSATLGIIVCANLKKNDLLGYCEQDCAAATQNILLEAHHLGLGGVWLGMHPSEGRAQRLKMYFQLPEHIHPLWMIAIGHPDEEGVIRDKNDPEVIHYEEW